MAFGEACQKAWTFFNNALSVHTELVYIQTSLVAIQAITVMVSLALHLSEIVKCAL